MSTRWMLGTAALLGFLVAGTATAQDKAEATTAGAAEAKPASEKAAAEGRAPKAHVKVPDRKVNLDSYGKPIRDVYIDSKKNEIAYKDVPLNVVFVCYPPYGSARSEKEPAKDKPARAMAVAELPKDYLCSPFQPNSNMEFRTMSLACPSPYYSCVSTSYPFKPTCCCCR